MIKMVDVSDVTLELADVGNAELIHSMKYKAFMPLYEKYHDDDTNPAVEPLEKTITLLQQDFTDYFLIVYQNQKIGAIRICKIGHRKDAYKISPLFILPEFQNRGMAQIVLQKTFDLYPEVLCWELATIEQELGNCYLYEKMGFVKNSFHVKINDDMTIIGYEKNIVIVRRFEHKDAVAVANLISRNFREVNVKDYGVDAMEALCISHNAEWVLNVTSYATMYVFCKQDEIIACGSISSFWGSFEESILLTVFVLPEYHGKGIGRRIIETLEQDELFTRAKRVEIPASITACEFYRKFGYVYKNGVKELDSEGLYRMEKYNKTEGLVIK